MIYKELVNWLMLAEYKKITNYEKTKEILQDITLELPEVPSIEDFNKVVFKRNEKIQNQNIRQEDDNPAYTTNDSVNQQVFQRTF